jgi:ribosomal protein L37AE/L43A
MLAMQSDPILDWQRLTEHYRQMSEGELLAVADDFADLTPTAQQVLRGELRNRGLGDRGDIDRAQAAAAARSALPLADKAPPAPSAIVTKLAGAFGADPPDLVPDTPDCEEEKAGPHEYTWKTPLCECDTREESWQIQEVLRRAGIESWIDFQGSIYPGAPSTAHRLGVGGLQVLVAADQLDQARATASRPIPAEIVEESETQVPDFTPPSCPKCGAGDPVLESVDPSNTWRCEQCGEQWADPALTGDPQIPSAPESAL